MSYVDPKDGWAELDRALESVGARATFDRRRNSTGPCWRCDTLEAERTLVAIGTYLRPMGGGLQPGDKIMRPLCAACTTQTEPAP